MKISVLEEGFKYAKWYVNLRQEVLNSIEYRPFISELESEISRKIRKDRGTCASHSMNVTFQNEEDAIAFLLKWG